MKTLILITMLTLTVVAEPNTPNVDYEKRCEILKKRIDSLEQEIKNVRNINKKLRMLCRKNKVKIEGLSDEDDLLFNGIAKSLEKPLNIGQVAYLGADSGNFMQRIWVKQVLDKSNMLAKLTLKTIPRHRSYRGEHTNVVTTVGYTSVDEIVWIKNIDTSGFTDNNEIKLYAPLKVVGTKNYNTIDGGTKTVFLLEPYIVAQPSE